MNSIKASLLLLLSSVPFLSGKSSSAIASSDEASSPPTNEDPVRLRPLNLPGDNHFAAHRSHSSHASHRSSSGGGSATPQPSNPPQPSTPPGPARGLVGPGTSQPTDSGRAAPVSPTPAKPQTPTLTDSEKLTLQIMRVQIALTTLGLFTGEVSGKLDTPTKEAIRRFQVVKGLKASGLMTTETLNALGVPAVQ